MPQASALRPLRRFAGDRSASFGIAAAAVIGALALAGGFALNTVQLSNARSHLLASLDAAVTSTARDLTTGVIEEADARGSVEAFLMANGAREFGWESGIALDGIDVDRQARTVTAQASMRVDLVFPLFSGEPVRRVTISSAAVYSDRDVEVAMMLDVTGSMAATWRSDKIGDLRRAAGNAVEQLLAGNRAGSERVRIALVPYAEAVNAGSLASRTVFVERRGGDDLPPPLDQAFSVSASSRPDNCATERKRADGSADLSDASPYEVRRNLDGRSYQALVNRDDRVQVCPSAAVMPLTSDRQRLLDAIDAFRADGYTAGGIAAQWGYYMLSPDWRGAIADASLGQGPADFDEREVSKVAILMTDGEFNTAFAGVRSSPRGGQPVRSAANAEAICTAMKRDGIQIFTIGFALPAGEASAARTVLRNCASPDFSSLRHFHDVSTGAELDAAFREIAGNIERLALTR